MNIFFNTVSLSLLTISDGELAKWLSNAETPVTSARAIISPHAGLVYCGETGAHGFKSINPATTRRIIVLGPSHKKYLSGGLEYDINVAPPPPPALPLICPHSSMEPEDAFSTASTQVSLK